MKTEYNCFRRCAKKRIKPKLYIIFLLAVSVIRIILSSYNYKTQENYVEAFGILGDALYSRENFGDTLKSACMTAFAASNEVYIYVDDNYGEEIFEY